MLRCISRPLSFHLKANDKVAKTLHGQRGSLFPTSFIKVDSLVSLVVVRQCSGPVKFDGKKRPQKTDEEGF